VPLGFFDGKDSAMADVPRSVRERVEAQGFLGLNVVISEN
jgi:hypothetical protein